MLLTARGHKFNLLIHCADAVATSMLTKEVQEQMSLHILGGLQIEIVS